ncbi:MAG: CehA/McbA family metallohydrolase [Chloroflexota bacterium]
MTTHLSRGAGLGPLHLGGHHGRADLHIHTCHSDGRPTVQDVLDYVANRTRLKVIAITDHDTIEGALRAQELQKRYRFDIVLGEEVTTRQGHVLALYIHERVPPLMSPQETIAAIHEQGGLAIAAHPFITAFGPEVQGIGRRFTDLPFDAVEVENSTPLMYVANYRAKRHNRRVGGLPVVGNSDAHIVEAVGKSYSRFPGTSAADLRLAIERRQTTAHASAYASRELLAYAGFWLASLKPLRSVRARADFSRADKEIER